MHDTVLRIYMRAQNLMESEEGQDLVEYALVASLLSLAATAAMGSLAGAINGAFNAVAAKLSAS